MAIAFWCVLAAGLLPLVTIGVAKWSHIREFDNTDPRDPQFYRSGFRARAWGAQQNGFEAFPFFAAAVMVATWHAAPQGWIDGLALIFLAARLAYTACYLGGMASLRSAVWSLGFLASVAIFLLPAVF